MPLISGSQDEKNQYRSRDLAVLRGKPSFSRFFAAHRLHLSLTHVYVRSFFHSFVHSCIPQSFHHLLTCTHSVNSFSSPRYASSTVPGAEDTTHRVYILLGRHNK